MVVHVNGVNEDIIEKVALTPVMAATAVPEIDEKDPAAEFIRPTVVTPISAFAVIAVPAIVVVIAPTVAITTTGLVAKAPGVADAKVSVEKAASPNILYSYKLAIIQCTYIKATISSFNYWSSCP